MVKSKMASYLTYIDKHAIVFEDTKTINLQVIWNVCIVYKTLLLLLIEKTFIFSSFRRSAKSSSPDDVGDRRKHERINVFLNNYGSVWPNLQFILHNTMLLKDNFTTLLYIYAPGI